MPQINPYRAILNEFVDEEFKPLVQAKIKSKTIPFSQMVLSNDEFKRALPNMSAEDIMGLSPDMRAKALEIDREGVVRKFNA